MRTDVCHQVASCRKSKHADFMRIDMIIRCVDTDEAYRSLRIFERRRRFRLDLAWDIRVANIRVAIAAKSSLRTKQGSRAALIESQQKATKTAKAEPLALLLWRANSLMCFSFSCYSLFFHLTRTR